MLPGLAVAIGVVRKFTWILAAAGALALAAIACEPDAPAASSVPPLTPPAVSAPSTTDTAPTQVSLPDATLLPGEGATVPPAAALAAAVSPTVPPEVVAATETKMVELTSRMLRARRVDVDVLWAVFVMNRAFGIGTDWAPDIEAPAKMLEMWDPENACFAMVEGDVERLGSDNHLTPVDFNAFVAHVGDQLSPCLEERWPEVEAERFFSNPESVRVDRVTIWFDSIWDLSVGDSLVSLEQCREGFYTHLPVAIAASDPHGLEGAWSAAMVEFSACRQEALREELPFVYLGNSQLFAFELNDRYTLIALQATVGGHLVAISMQRPYGECWPDFAASIPEIATATGPAQLVESRDAALRALRACIEVLPEHNPFAGQ